MKPIDEMTLMAYADGELDGEARIEVERAMAADAALAARVGEMVALRQRLRAGLDAELADPVPDQWLATLQVEHAPAPPSAPVTDLGAVRALRQAKAPRAPRAAMSWRYWGGMAASLLLGVVIARLWPAGSDAAVFARQGGALVARGEIASALSTRLASDRDGSVAVPLSFVDRSGAYCRTFVVDRTAGLACREGEAWVVEALAAAEPAPGGTMRQAASALPPTILEAVDQRIAGQSLDAAGERSARDGGWQPR